MQEKGKNAFKSVLNFAEEKGFYIILGLCVVAIGVSGYVLFFAGDTLEVSPVVLENPTLVYTEPIPPFTVRTTESPITEPGPEVTSPLPPDEVPVVRPTEISVPSTQAVNPLRAPEQVFVKPAKGEVDRPFSGDELVFDATMGDWRVHRGVDILCAPGADVVSITAGTVKAIFTDPMFGHGVKVTHENGLESIYFGLTVNQTVKTGQEVKAGTVIGKAGDPPLAESSQPGHIHVEVTRNGQHIDPISLLK